MARGIAACRVAVRGRAAARAGRRAAREHRARVRGCGPRRRRDRLRPFRRPARRAGFVRADRGVGRRIVRAVGRRRPASARDLGARARPPLPRGCRGPVRTAVASPKLEARPPP